MMYDSWDTKCNRQNFFVILDNFLPFYPPNSPKNENFKKMTTKPGDIIILHKCTKNHEHMLYCFWDMVHDGCNCYFSFWAIFHLFTPVTAWKIKISKKWEKHRDIIILHKCTKIHDHMLNWSWDMVHHICNYFSFWAIFCPFTPPPLPPNSPKIKISKKWKKILEISSFYTCVPKVMIWWCTISQIWCATDGQRDGQADSQKEKVTYRGGCPPEN